MAKPHVRLMIVLLGCCSFAAAYGVQRTYRDDMSSLEADAVLAWNAGDVKEAESMARRALSRSAESSMARAVLIQVAAHDADPLLHISALLSTPESDPEAVQSWFAASEIAYQHGFAVIAEQASRRVLESDPTFVRAYDRLVGLASVRLNAERTATLLIRRSQHVPLDQPAIRLLLGAESMHTESAAMLDRLVLFLNNDRNDEQSAVGISRCLRQLNRFDEAERILSEPQSQEGRIERASVLLALGRPDEAAAILPGQPPLREAGEYWKVLGQLALHDAQFADARAAFETAISLRPLDRELRSSYCETLRQLGRIGENRQQSRILTQIQKVQLYARNPSSRWGREDIEALIADCDVMGAPNYAEQLRLYQQARTN